MTTDDDASILKADCEKHPLLMNLVMNNIDFT